MKRFLLILCAAAALCGVTVSYASGPTATVSWVAPTTYNDAAKTPVPATDIAFYTVIWVDSGGATNSVKVTAPVTTTPAFVGCGTANFTVTLTTTATAKYPNATSDPSSPAVPYATGVTCKPNPATGVTAN